MTKWQYRIIPLQEFEDFVAVEATLDQFGAEGWEVFAIQQSGNNVKAVMKRINEAAPGAPVNVTPPTLNKVTAAVGTDVMCEPGEWSDGGVLTFQWQRDGNNITDGASAPTYRVKSADAGKALTCAVTNSTDLGYATALSGVCTVT